MFVSGIYKPGCFLNQFSLGAPYRVGLSALAPQRTWPFRSEGLLWRLKQMPLSLAQRPQGILPNEYNISA